LNEKSTPIEIDVSTNHSDNWTDLTFLYLVNRSSAWKVDEGTVEDSLGNAYQPEHFVIADGSYSNTYAQYNSRQLYTRIKGKIAPSQDMDQNSECVLKIYADNALVYTSQKITRTTYAFDFTVEKLNKCKIIKIEVLGGHYNSSLLLLDFCVS
jgi:hypothetical protein